MIGKIVLGLLAVSSFSYTVTKGEEDVSSLKFDPNTAGECKSFIPTVSVTQITFYAFVLKASGTPSNCSTVNITRLDNLNNTFLSTNNFDNNGNIATQKYYLVANPEKPGQFQSYTFDSNGVPQLRGTSVIVGYKVTFVGTVYAVVSCTPLGKIQEVVINSTRIGQVLRILQNIVNELVKILRSDERLQNMKFNEVPQGGGCTYSNK